MQWENDVCECVCADDRDRLKENEREREKKHPNVCTIVVIEMRVLLLRFCVRMCSFHDICVCAFAYSI